MRVDLGELTFDVTVAGPADAPAVLLLHGFPENATMWDGVAPLLHAAGLRTVAFDQRGYAPDARPAGTEAYRLSEIVTDALGVLDALGLTEPVHVVGHDWGAIVAWLLAGRHPERVRTLTAVAVPHPAAHGWAMKHDRGQRLRSLYIAGFRTRKVPERVLLAGNAFLLRQMFRPLPKEAVGRFVRPMRQPGALTAALNWYRAVSRDEMRVGPVRVPVTYLWGTRDPAVGRAAAERCAKWVTGDYRFVALDGVSHWVPEQVPDRVAAEIIDRVTG